MNMKVFESGEKNVWKYIFTTKEYVLESVLYKYNSFEERTVICCSVQSGCPIGCTFCGTGENFIKNIKSEDIVKQIEMVLKDKDIEDINTKSEKFQIMFMSMGEPMLNWNSLKNAIKILNKKYKNADLLISTIGVDNDTVFKDIIETSKEINKIGLQFSIHESNDIERNKLIPFEKKYSLRDIRDRGVSWQIATGRNVYLNYCIHNDSSSNGNNKNIEELKNIFSPIFFNFTFSVICESDETMKDKVCQDLDYIRKFENSFIKDGYNTRIFDPAGQDDIGGGCGQLWNVQEYLKKNKKGKDELI